MEQEYIIMSALGLHVRPAKRIVEAAKKFSCQVELVKDGKHVSAKGLVQVLTLGAKQGDRVTLITEGEGEAEAQEVIGAILSEAAEAAEHGR